MNTAIGFERVTKKRAPRSDPFNELYIRTWRDRARYAGPEALGQEGPNALMRLPWLMEEIFDWWEKMKMRPQFKAEYLITHNIRDSLTQAAEVTAGRLKLNKDETQALIERFHSYTQELRGPGVRRVPPFLFGTIAQGISKAGNRLARHKAQELAWLWLQHQPQSALSRWFYARLGTSQSKRLKRVLAVALARKLVVALWRYLTAGVVPEGARLDPC